MKKLIQCVMIITCCALLFALMGCSSTPDTSNDNSDFLNANSQNTQPSKDNTTEPTTPPTQPTTPSEGEEEATKPTNPPVNWDDLELNDDVLNPGGTQDGSGNTDTPGGNTDKPGSNPGTPSGGSDASNLGQLRNALNYFGKTSKNNIVLYSQSYDGIVNIIYIINNGNTAVKKEYTFYEDANAYAAAKVGLTSDQYNNELQIILVGVSEITAVTDPENYPAVLFSGYTIWR